MTFVCKLNDGRRFLATAPAKVFSVMQQAALKSAYYRTSWGAPTPELSDEEQSLLPSENPNHPGHINGYENKRPPKKRLSLMKKLLWTVGGLFVFCIFLGAMAALTASTQTSPTSTPFNVTISVAKSGGNMPVISGKTNLPDGLKLIVSINRTNGAELGGQDAIVANGQFQTGPFSIGTHGYRPGKYIAEITSSLASLQSSDVQAVIGNTGQYMKGAAVVQAAISPPDKVIDYSAPFRVP